MGCLNSKEAIAKQKVLQIGQQGQNAELKIVLIGEAGVGKSSIAQRYCKNIFPEKYEVTIGGAYLQKNVVLKNGNTIKLHIWDTGGEERFRNVVAMFYRDISAAILVYDITKRESFKGISY